MAQGKKSHYSESDITRIIEQRFENEVARNFQPLYRRKWSKSNYSIKIFNAVHSGPSYKGVSNHEVIEGLNHFGTYAYGLNYFGAGEGKTILHRVGAPASFGIRNNEVEKIHYFLFGNSLPVSNYWPRVLAMKPEVYLTKLIGSKLFIETVSSKIPAPSFIDLHGRCGRYTIQYNLKGKNVNALKYWNYWEQHFTILQDFGFTV